MHTSETSPNADGAQGRATALPLVAERPPKTPDDARRQFVELYGSALVRNTTLQIALVLLALVALGLLGLTVYTANRAAQVKPLVVRIDAVGRAEAVAYDATVYQPQPPELRYFLTQFVVTHFSRIRATLQRAYPASLLFLAPALADATMARDTQTRTLDTFLTQPTAEEIDIEVQNVSLSELTRPPFKAAVTFQEVALAPGTRTERRRSTFVAQVEFVLRDDVPNALVPVNPLGLQITYFRVDQAFEERR